MNAEKRKTSLFGPILLIGFGLILLLSNLGVLDFNLWDLLFRFWPLFLIAAGLDLLLGRRANSGALLALLLLAGLIIGGIWLGYGSSIPFTGGAFTGGERQTISQSLEGATRAVVDIEASVSQLQIKGGATGTQLIEGNVALQQNEKLQTDFRVTDGTAHYSLKSDSRSLTFPTFGRRESRLWDLQLNAKTPTALAIATGVGSATLDLELLQVTQLDVSTGVGEVEITLPTQGVFDATVKGGVGEIVILIPDTLAAQIEAHAGIGSVNVKGDYTHRGDLYTSSNFDGAQQRVTLTVNGGIGAVTIRQVSKR